AYPSAPQSWAARFSYELGLFDPDSISAAHRAEFARLERAFIETSQPDPSAMAWLGIYAIDLGYLDSAERWIAGARSRGPTVPAVVMGETILLMVKHGHTPAELLPALENLWGRLPKRSGRVAHAGWQAAIAAGDMSATVRWADRYLRERPSEELALLPAVSAAEELRPQLRRWLEEFVAAPGRWNENDRPLHLPVHAYLKTVAERLQRAAAESAALAAGEGNTLEARRLAILGADLSWQPESLVQIARILISTRDSIEGLRILARAEADPGARPAVAVSPLTEIDSGWPDRVAEARSALREYVMDGAIIRYLPDDMRLLGPEGRVPFSEILEGHSTVVAFLSRYCAPALTDAARMPALAERVAELGADLVVVNIDNSPDLDAYLAAVGYNGAVYRDDRGEARSAFQSSATADYFVLDSAGRVRFEHSGFDELARQIWVLQSSEAPATVSD
ncbi:MAG TPA: redoxin domain-containing protein, partial [Longimicrobiales bacterium]|nr:redoxin domain-containing protein [Longimicrobiales bacterium]